MGVKYSNIDGIRNCEIHDGVLYLDTVGGRGQMEFDVPIYVDLLTPHTASDELSKRRIIAECNNGDRAFVLYKNFHWNFLDTSQGQLLDFGEIAPFNMVYTYQLVGSILHKNSYRAIYVDRINKIGYITENERSACLRDFEPKELVGIFHSNQSLCLSKASDTPEVGYCGSEGNLYTVDYYTGEVRKYAGSY